MTKYPLVVQTWWDVAVNAPEELRNKYVYVWFYQLPSGQEIPFYVGSGQGYRWKSKGSRNRGFKQILSHHKNVYSRKIMWGLTEPMATHVEDQLKRMYIGLGYQIMDGEMKENRKQKQRWISAGKRYAREHNPNYREGKKRTPINHDKFLEYKQLVDNKKISMRKACRELGISTHKYYAEVERMALC